MSNRSAALQMRYSGEFSALAVGSWTGIEHPYVPGVMGHMAAAVWGRLQGVVGNVVVEAALGLSRSRRQLGQARSLQAEVEELRRRIEVIERQLGLGGEALEPGPPTHEVDIWGCANMCCGDWVPGAPPPVDLHGFSLQNLQFCRHA